MVFQETTVTVFIDNKNNLIEVKAAWLEVNYTFVFRSLKDVSFRGMTVAGLKAFQSSDDDSIQSHANRNASV